MATKTGEKSNMSGRLRHMIPVAVFIVSIVCACSPVTRYEVLTTIFDGVPSLPPPEKYCADYAAQTASNLRAEMSGRKNSDGKQDKSSTHPPYAEKKCDGCHDKSTDSGFVVNSRNDLCFVCHTGFFKGSYVHGPAAVGDCLACHDPHSSSHPALLKVSQTEICTTCHHEKRVASSLHEMAASHELICTDCHDPHSGNVHYFLK
jgi:predicted CXXCH cytochrome family protein